MNAAALWRFLRHRVFIFDPWLSTVLLAISLISLVTMYSAAGEGSERLVVHARNLGMAVLITWLVASLSPRRLMTAAIPLYLAGLALLFCVELFGVSAKGAKRWLDLGFTRIQPAELMKIAIPLMLAWFFHISQNRLRSRYVHLMAIMLLVLPVALVGRQPDLGTAIRTGIVLVMAWVMVGVTGRRGGAGGVPRGEVAWILASGVATCASWLCYFRALQDGPASVVMPVDKLSILVSVAFSVLVLRERVGARALVGLAVLVAGTVALAV